MAQAVVLKKADPHQTHTKRPVKTEDSSDPVVMTYRALKPIRVADDETGETTHMRQFGDFVPEAATWRRPDTWLRNGFIEVVYANKSEISKWRKVYLQRVAEEDAELAEKNAEEQELQELQRRIRELENRKAKKAEAPDFNAKPGKVLEEKIDFGGVKMASGGLPAPVQLTRAPQLPKNIGQNRAQPLTVRRAVRKKG